MSELQRLEHFGKLMELASEPERHAYLEGISDPNLRQELCELIRGLGTSPDFLEQEYVPPFTPPAGFEVLRELGRGSTSTVYLAKELALDRHVALKVVWTEPGNEGPQMARLEHPHIVKVYSQGRCEALGYTWLCTQWIEGWTLAELLEEPALWGKWGQGLEGLLVRWAVELTSALECAHARGVLHLDIKPQNILIDTLGRSWLADFSVAIGTAEGLPKGGTFGYMAPEQAEYFEKKVGVVLDGRCDVYGLGKVLEEAYRRLQLRLPDLERHFARAAHPSRELRYPSAGDFHRALRSYLDLVEIRGNIPIAERVKQLFEKGPGVCLVLAAAVPQFFASCVNILYNGGQVVGRLSLSQQKAFPWLCGLYNLLVYGVAAAVFFHWVGPIVRALKPAAPSRPDLRQIALRLPRRLLLLTTAGWLPAAVFFPLCLRAYGKVSARVWGHFAVSVSLSWLVAVSYTLSLWQAASWTLVYPRLWREDFDRETARKEVGFRWLPTWAYHLGIYVPALASLGLLWVPGVGDLVAERELLTCFILLGLFGSFLSRPIERMVEQTKLLFCVKKVEQEGRCAPPALSWKD